MNPHHKKHSAWFYDRKEHGVTNMEVGCLMTMDRKLEVPFVRDPSNRFYFEDCRRLEDGCFDLSYTAKVLYSLARGGWVEAVAFDQNMKPMAFKRTDKVPEHSFTY